MSQEQKDRVEQQEVQMDDDQQAESSSSASSPDSTPSDSLATQPAGEMVGAQQKASPTGKKRARRKTRLVNVAEITPHPSIWPLILAFSLVVVLFGILSNYVVVGVGVLLVVGSIVGWIVERR